MKTSYKKLIGAASAAMLCALLSAPVFAQHTSSGSGGGSGSSSSHASSGGGGSAPAARPSSGGSYSRPSVAGSGAYRPSGSPATSGARGSGAQRPTYVYRQGAIVRNTAPGTIGVRSTGNYGYPSRTGVTTSAAGYRSAPRVGSYWGVHGYYHYNHGYYTTYYLARLGYTCRVLPYGYYPFFWGDYQYFFCDGLYYTYADDQYTVVEPPLGAEVTSLPDNAQSIVINGQQYYECNGVYYQPVTKDDGSTVYMVAGKDGVLNTDQSNQTAQPAAPQLGDIVSQLPQDCRKLKINGDVLWVSPDGIYYKEMVDANGVKTYKIVGLPDDQNGNNQSGGQSTSGQ
jgi:hypothetical protein